MTPDSSRLPVGCSPKDIIEYYEGTLLEYRYVLSLHEHHGIHFGYFDGETSTISDAILKMNEVLASAIDIEPGSRILDAGCGIGGSALWLAKNFDVHITGITLSDTQRLIASHLAELYGLQSRTRFLVEDYSSTSFDNSSFDVLWGLESVCYAPDKADFLKEAARLLRPGGTLVIADGFLSQHSYSKAQKRVLERWLRGWAVPDLVSLNEFKEQCQASGFRQVAHTDLTYNVLPFSRWLSRKAMYLLPVAKILSWIGLFSPIQVRNGASCFWQHVALKRSLWTYSLVRGIRDSTLVVLWALSSFKIMVSYHVRPRKFRGY